MAIQIRKDSAWSTVKNISAFNGTSWVTSANAAIWDGTSWVGFLDKVNISSNTYVDTRGDGGIDAEAYWSLQSDGSVNTNKGASSVYNWCQNPNNTDLYEAEVVVVSNTAPVTGTAVGSGIWTLLNSNRTWTVKRDPIGESEAQLTIKIRNAASTQELASANINLVAIVSA
jgi:hypothetical protein